MADSRMQVVAGTSLPTYTSCICSSQSTGRSLRWARRTPNQTYMWRETPQNCTDRPPTQGIRNGSPTSISTMLWESCSTHMSSSPLPWTLVSRAFLSLPTSAIFPSPSIFHSSSPLPSSLCARSSTTYVEMKEQIVSRGNDSVDIITVEEGELCGAGGGSIVNLHRCTHGKN